MSRVNAYGWLRQKKIKQVDIQIALGHRSPTQVCETLAGRRHDRQVLQWLIDNGCPERYLALPADMRRAA